MNYLNKKNILNITMIAGISSLIGTIAQIEFMIIEKTGLLSDYISVLTAILILPLLYYMGKIASTTQKNLGLAIQILGVLGTLINFVGGIINVLALEGFIEFEHQASWIMVGTSLVGFSILIFTFLILNKSDFKKTYYLFNIIFGSAMSLSFIGLMFRDELNAIMQATQSISESSIGLKILLFFAGPIVILGHAIWVFWSRRELLINLGVENE